MANDPPPFVSPYYERCTNPECEFAYAYRHPFPAVDHWHYVGPERETGA